MAGENANPNPVRSQSYREGRLTQPNLQIFQQKIFQEIQPPYSSFIDDRIHL